MLVLSVRWWPTPTGVERVLEQLEGSQNPKSLKVLRVFQQSEPPVLEIHIQRHPPHDERKSIRDHLKKTQINPTLYKYPRPGIPTCLSVVTKS